MARWFQYQVEVDPVPQPSVAVAAFLAVVQFTGLLQYQVKAEPVFVPAEPAVISVATSPEVFFPRSIIYQSSAYVQIVEEVPVVVDISSFSDNVNVQLTSPWQYQIKAEPLVAAVNLADTVYVPVGGDVRVTFKRSWQYQVKADPVFITTAEAITVDKWFEPLSEPTRRKQLITHQEFFSPFNYVAPIVYVPATETVSVQFKSKWQYQVKSDPIAVVAPEVITEDKWHQEWSQPVRIKPKVVFQQNLIWSGFTEPVVTAIEPTTVSLPVFFPRSLIYEDLASVPLPTPTEVITEDKWHQEWSQPVKVRRLSTAAQQTLVWSGFTPDVVAAVVPATISSQVIFPKSLIYEDIAFSPVTTPPETITEDKWHQEWSQPVRTRRLATAQQQTLAWSGFTPAVVAAIVPTAVSSQVIFPRSLIYEDFTSVISTTPPEVITEDKWHQSWSEPVRTRRLATAQQQTLAWSGFTPASVARVVPATVSSQVVFPRSIIYEESTWSGFTPPPVVVPTKGFVQGDVGLTFQKTVIYQELSEVALSAVVPPFWDHPWSEPVRRKWAAARAIPVAQNWLTPPTEVVSEESKWHQPWSEPVRTRRFPTADQQFLAWSGFTPDPVVVTYYPYVSGDTGLIFRKKLIYQSSTGAPSSESRGVQYEPWAEPVRPKRGLAVYLQQEPAWNTLTQAVTPGAPAAVITSTATAQVHFPRSIIYQSVAWAPYPIIKPVVTFSFGTPGDTGLIFRKKIIYQSLTQATSTETHNFWFEPLAEPVRTKQGLGAWHQRDPFWSTFVPTFVPPAVPAVVTATTSPPVIFPRGIIYQSITYAPQNFTVEVIREDKWHQPWSIPVKLKKTLLPHLQQAFTAPPIQPTFVRTIAWYAPLAEPVRQKKGLWARLQQFFSTDANKPPTPPEFVTLDATETNNDIASIYAVVYNPAVRCYVSIKEVPGNDESYASIEETG